MLFSQSLQTKAIFKRKEKGVSKNHFFLEKLAEKFRLFKLGKHLVSVDFFIATEQSFFGI